MKRSDFLRLCTLAGVAGGTGIASAAPSASTPDLFSALRAAGLSGWSVLADGELLHLRGRVVDFGAFSRQAARLGEGKVRASGNVLSFQRGGRSIRLELQA